MALALRTPTFLYDPRMAWEEFAESLKSPSSVLVCGAVCLLFAFWNQLTTYAPSDSTPRHTVEGVLASTQTTRDFHSTRPHLFRSPIGRNGWDAATVTLNLQDGKPIHYTEHERKEQHTAYPMSVLPKGTSIQAQVDADGQIWQLTANDREILSLSDTLARHRTIRHWRNMTNAILVLLGIGLLGFGVLRMKSASDD